MKIQSQPPRPQPPNRSLPSPSEGRPDPKEILDSVQFQEDLQRGSLRGVVLGSVIAGGLALALRSPNLGVVAAMTLSGALVGGCIAEEQVKLKWGLPVEMPPAYR